MAAIKVGVIGIGGMGGVHVGAYAENPQADLVAVCDVNEEKLQGGGGTSFNLGGGSALDFSNVKKFTNYEELIADPEIELVDICLPTPLHAPVTLAALRAGKHVLCEKPMAMNSDECGQMQEAAQAAGKQLLIGHCLRYWSDYVQAKEIIDGGEYGKPLYASFHRSSATPVWSWSDWLRTGDKSGGAVFDMHIHDADAAVWWFGRPDSISADGVIKNGLPVFIDSTWRYNDGPVVALHGSWDDNGGPFRFAFKVVLEKATIVRDSLNDSFQLIIGNNEGGEVRDLTPEAGSAYHNEINDFVSCLTEGRMLSRVTPQGSRESVEVVLEELNQIKQKNS